LRRRSEPFTTTASTRRQFLRAALAGASSLALVREPATAATPEGFLVENITRLNAVRVSRIALPRSTEQVRQALADWPGQVSIGGARCSMGGQIALRDSLHLDLRALNKIVWFKPEEARVRVQAGMRWRELQEVIDPHELSVRTMQSYANFTVGGSVSVNVHGRYVGHGPISGSIRALQLVLADGRVVEASAGENAGWFHAAIGGFGALGVVTEVELELDRNCRLERRVVKVPLAEYPDWFLSEIRTDPAVLLHNADVYPRAFNSPVAISWRRTELPLTQSARLRPEHAKYVAQRSAIWAVTELPGGKAAREHLISPMQLKNPEVVWRNYEASLDIDELRPFSHFVSTFALQEYFVPVRSFQSFASSVARILRRSRADALNLSIRHSPADPRSLMAWAREDVFCFVIYYKQRVLTASQRHVRDWTRSLVAAALDHGGSYYLPYQLHATTAQFRQSYPRADEFGQIKAQLDPGGRFSNEMWRKYFGW
jgi:FAD/FMN-containing dehydrogenase